MSYVLLEGQFLGASLNTRKYPDREVNEVLVDIYQPQSPLVDKNVRIQAEDVTLMNKFQNYKMGQSVNLRCSVRGYKDKLYFKLIDVSSDQKLVEAK